MQTHERVEGGATPPAAEAGATSASAPVAPGGATRLVDFVLAVAFALTIAATGLLLASPVRYSPLPPRTLDVLHASSAQMQAFESAAPGLRDSWKDVPDRFQLVVQFSGGVPSSFSRYENLFQTDDGPSGLRAELGPPSVLALVVPADLGAPARGIIVTPHMTLGGRHELRVDASLRFVNASLDGVPLLTLPAPAALTFGHVVAGTGFHHARQFSGTIEKFIVIYAPNRVGAPGLGDQVAPFLLFVLLVLLPVVMISRAFSSNEVALTRWLFPRRIHP